MVLVGHCSDVDLYCAAVGDDVGGLAACDAVYAKRAFAEDRVRLAGNFIISQAFEQGTHLHNSVDAEVGH